MKVKSDHRSNFSNLSNWKEEAWKISSLKPWYFQASSFQLFKLENLLPWSLFTYITYLVLLVGYVWFLMNVHQSLTSLHKKENTKTCMSYLTIRKRRKRNENHWVTSWTTKHFCKTLLSFQTTSSLRFPYVNDSYWKFVPKILAVQKIIPLNFLKQVWKENLTRRVGSKTKSLQL